MAFSPKSFDHERMTSAFHSRRDVIELYVRYDAEKKGSAMPDFTAWPWDSADGLDEQLGRHGFKPGVLSGFVLWHSMSLGRQELLECAVVNSIFPRKSQALSILCREPEFMGWVPDRDTAWFEAIESGAPYDERWPFILRPAVASEAPARWYIEDGSGRGVGLLRRLLRNENDHTKAPAFVGAVPDPTSTFMQRHFASLLDFIGSGMAGEVGVST